MTEITSLIPYLAKVLLPDKDETNGTAFFCHPEGYLLTCYHVIAPYLGKQENEVRIGYEGNKGLASFCPELSCPDADIAVLKLHEPPSQLCTLDLDVHNRTSLSDVLQSFGYPKGLFEKPGIPFSCALVGHTPTVIDGTEVLSIKDLTAKNIDYGYSGAPLFNQRTQKVMGLISMKYTETQAFCVPVHRVFQTWPEVKRLHDVYHKIRSTFAANAEQKLKEKLKDTEFIPLNLEYRVITEREGEIQARETVKSHARKWESLELGALLPPAGRYTLNSDVGTGKTTFFYWLVKQLVDTTPTAPICISCAEVERGNLSKWDDLQKDLIASYRVDILEADLEDFFKAFLSENRLVFLFDGLDQIRGRSYSGFVRDTLFKIASRNPLIVSSRPSAVLALEDRSELTFLKLRPFTISDQKRYFAENYSEAKRLATFAPELLSVPMLAFMVQTLIRANKSQGISTRTELYEKFLAHILSHHEPNIPIFREQRSLTKKMEESLRKISFVALDQKEPQIQMIEERLYDGIGSPVSVEELTTFGLANLIMGRGEQPFIRFTHQSFQEFLAAQYISEHAELIDKVLDEMWAAKWREVIKFLAGLRGEEVIERIFSGQDNVIHSRLFLAAEAVPEAKELEGKTKESIMAKVKVLVREEPFDLHAISALGRLGNVDYLRSLLGDKGLDVRYGALYALAQVPERLDDATIQKMVEWLKNEDWYVREAVGEALAKIPERLDDATIQKMVEWLKNEDWYVRMAAFEVFAKIPERLDDATIQKMVECINDDHPYVRKAAIEAAGKVFAKIPERLDDATKGRIVSWTQWHDHWARYVGRDEHRTQRWAPRDEHWIRREAAREVRGQIPVRFYHAAIDEIIGWLKDGDWYVREAAFEVLAKIPERLNEATIEEIAGWIKDQDLDLREAAYRILRYLYECGRKIP